MPKLAEPHFSFANDHSKNLLNEMIKIFEENKAFEKIRPVLEIA
jgi:hypothetical protein